MRVGVLRRTAVFVRAFDRLGQGFVFAVFCFARDMMFSTAQI
jgi:hypothetical protein